MARGERQKPPIEVLAEQMVAVVERSAAATETANDEARRQNGLLAQLAENTRHREPPRIGRRSHPRPLGQLTPIAHFQFFIEGRVPVRKVPEPYFDRRGDLALVVCTCRRGHRLMDGHLHECDCGRVFLYTGKGMFAANPNEGPEPVVD